MTAKKPPAQAVKLAKTEPNSATSVFEKLQKLERDRAVLDENRRALLATAKAELLDKAQRVLAQLKNLGFAFALTEVPKKSKADPVQGSSPQERATPRVTCGICGYDTMPQHDRRAHRFQEPKTP